MLLLDGVYVENSHGGLRFHRVNAPSVDELKALVHAISHRVARFLEKRGFLERDAENSYLALEPDDDDAMAQLQGHSITYRIAVGPQQGRKVFTLQALPPDEELCCALWGSGGLTIGLSPRIGLKEVENWCVEGDLAASWAGMGGEGGQRRRFSRF